MKRILCILIILVTVISSGCTNTDKGDNKKNTPTPQVTPTSSQVSQNPTSEPEETTEPKENEQIGISDKFVVKGMAKDILKNMTLEEKIGQLFIVNFELLDDSKGSYYEWRNTTKKMIHNLDKYKIGGVIFFARNIENREQTMKFIQNLQKNRKFPLFISVDEEGGDVARIGSNTNMKTTEFESMEQVGKLNDKKYAHSIGKTIGKEIRELGFNLDFAPVADVKTNEANTEIGNRSFGSDPEVVSSMVQQVVIGLQEEGVSATLKHFPGHGDVSENSHEGSVNVENDIERLRKIDFKPFAAGVDAGVDFIMASHISISRVTESTVPASLCPLVLQDMIRTELRFEGVVITDAMNMKAITDDYNAKEAAVTAIKSGVDIILMPENLEQAYQGILEAVKDGTISEERINESVDRILQVKIKRGLILEDTDLIIREETIK